MSDNSLRITFDYKYPDEPALIVYKYFGGGYFMGSEPTISVVRAVVGEEALDLYSKLSGKDKDSLREEAGYDKENL